MTKPVFGVWVDDSPKMIMSAEYWDRFVDLGYHTAALVLDSSYSEWDARYTITDLRTVKKFAVVERDIELVGTFWPVPHKKILERMYLGLDEMIGESGMSAVESDVEGLMLQRVAREMGWNIRDAKLTLLDYLAMLKYKHDVRIEVTTHPDHPEAKDTAIISSSEIVDRNCWQVYSTRHDYKGCVILWNSRYGPFGRLVDTRRLANLSRKWGKKYTFGQAAWDQKWPGHTVEEAMTIPHTEFMQYEPVEIRDWASGRMIGRFQKDGNNPQIIAARRKLIQSVL